VKRLCLILGVLALATRSAAAQSQIVEFWGGAHVEFSPPPGRTFTSIAAGYGNTAALLSDGTAIVWGNDYDHQSDVPPLPIGLEYVQIDVGAYHAVALRSDGDVVAWGRNSDGQCTVPALPAGLRYVEVSAGCSHTLARRSDGSVVAWGLNDFGQCDVPPLPPGMTYVEVSAGGHWFDIFQHSVARRSDGAVIGWGSFGDAPPPPTGVTYVAISAGESHTLALRSDGHVIRWGDCFTSWCAVPPLPPGLTYTAVAAGWSHDVALRSDGAVVGWGMDDDSHFDVPEFPPGLHVAELAASSGSTLVRLEGCPTCELPFCLGDGGPRSDACPCANDGARSHGCENSASTGGAKLSVGGSIDPDRVVLETSGALPSSACTYFQGSALATPEAFGDGARCIGGLLERLGTKTAVGGSSSYPESGDPRIRARSRALGDPIAPGSFRYYQVVYRDASTAFCTRATFNTSNAVMVAW
jgi:hypothetical protein